MEQQQSVLDRLVSVLLQRIEQEQDPEKAAKWVELLERVVGGQVKRFEEEERQKSTEGR